MLDGWVLLGLVDCHRNAHHECREFSVVNFCAPSEAHGDVTDFLSIPVGNRSGSHSGETILVDEGSIRVNDDVFCRLEQVSDMIDVFVGFPPLFLIGPLLRLAR